MAPARLDYVVEHTAPPPWPAEVGTAGREARTRAAEAPADLQAVPGSVSASQPGSLTGGGCRGAAGGRGEEEGGWRGSVYLDSGNGPPPGSAGQRLAKQGTCCRSKDPCGCQKVKVEGDAITAHWPPTGCLLALCADCKAIADPFPPERCSPFRPNGQGV